MTEINTDTPPKRLVRVRKPKRIRNKKKYRERRHIEHNRPSIEMFDCEAMKTNRVDMQKIEELGRKIGIVLHWLIVKPFQLFVVLVKAFYMVLVFIAENLFQIMGLAATILLGSLIFIIVSLAIKAGGH